MLFVLRQLSMRVYNSLTIECGRHSGFPILSLLTQHSPYCTSVIPAITPRAGVIRERKVPKSEFAKEKWVKYTIANRRPRYWSNSNRWRLKLPKKGSKAEMARVREVKNILDQVEVQLHLKKNLDRFKSLSVFNTIDKGAFEELTEEELQELQPIYKNSKELRNAPEELQRMYTMRYADRASVIKYRIEKERAKYQLFVGDNRSLESQVAAKTVRLRNLQTQCQKNRRDRRSRLILNKMVQRRDRDLRELREWNVEQWQQVVSGMSLDPQPTSPPVRNYRDKWARYYAVTRYLELRRGKLEELKVKLSAEQEGFRAEKATLLEGMARREPELGITEEDVREVLHPQELKVGEKGMRMPPLKVKLE